MKNCLFIILATIFFAPNFLMGQITIQSGTSFHVLSGTNVKTNTDTLHIQGNVINDGLIQLGQNAVINETIGNPIIGTGIESISYFSNTILNNQNIGGLGFSVTTSYTGDTLHVRRGHQDIFSPNSSVLRWFEVNAPNNLIDDFGVLYDFTELNSLIPDQITLLTSFDTTNQNNWINLGGLASPYQVTNPIFDSIQYLVISRTQISIDQINNTIYCEGDTLQIDYTADGIFNSGNLFYIELSDENGVFGNTPLLLDSIVAGTTGSIETVIPALTLSTDYSIRISSNNPKIISDTLLNITISPTPTISFANVPIEVCQNENAFFPSVQPQGGIYSGDAIDDTLFVPYIANIGNENFTYEYTNIYGCSQIDSTTIEILAVTDAQISLSQNEVCLDSTLINITPNPAGGYYQDPAISNDVFDPIVSGSGSQEVLYFYENNLGCTDTAFAILEVHPLPNVEVLGLNDTYCENDPFEDLTLSPAGGDLSGDGIQFVNQFYPNIATEGVHTITYEFTDQNGCFNNWVDDVIVYPNPATPTISANGNVLASDVNGNLQWYLNGNPISGADQQFYTANDDGFYSVEITNANGCIASSDLFNLIYNSTHNLNQSDFNIYPNPFLSYIDVSGLSFNKEYQIKIINSLGEIVYTQSTENKETVTLNLQTLANGIYMITVDEEDSQEIIKKRIIKQ